MTTFVSLETILPEALQFARGAPELLLLREIREAARVLCATTRVWRSNVTLTITTPAQQALPTVTHAEVSAIEDPRLDGMELDPIAVQDLDLKRPGWRTDAEEGAARYITQLEPDTITLYPRQTGDLALGLVLKPSDTATSLPDWLVRKYRQRIGRGAAGRVLLLPNTEYANAALGGALVAEFEGMSATALSVAKGQQRARVRTRGSFF